MKLPMAQDSILLAQSGQGAGVSDTIGPAVDANIGAALGNDLRAVFSSVLDEPIPQRFIDLLDNLVKEAT